VKRHKRQPVAASAATPEPSTLSKLCIAGRKAVGRDESDSKPPEQNAEELAKLAAGARDPGSRIWYLEWAKAFRKLALFNQQPPPPPSGH
jgi:hypothetical protein